MWWTLPVILVVIVIGIAILLCGVVCCVQRCFYPEGTRGPVERYDATMNYSKTKYITKDGPSWKQDPEDVGPVTVYTS